MAGSRALLGLENGIKINWIVSNVRMLELELQKHLIILVGWLIQKKTFPTEVPSIPHLSTFWMGQVISQPNSCCLYISAEVCGLPFTRILYNVSERKLCNTQRKGIFQLDVSKPNLNLLWRMEAKRMLKRTRHHWTGRYCNSFAISC